MIVMMSRLSWATELPVGTVYACRHAMPASGFCGHRCFRHDLPSDGAAPTALTTIALHRDHDDETAAFRLDAIITSAASTGLVSKTAFGAAAGVWFFFCASFRIDAPLFPDFAAPIL
jgi:hypothetical protein